MTSEQTRADALTLETESEDPAVLRRKVGILRRHVDHLLGQLYHQIELIKLHRDRAGVLEKQLDELKDCPKQLDEALKLISNLKEDIAGRKEVELELRRHQEILDREDSDKDRHIERLEGMLNKIWDTPVRRAWRTVRRTLGMKIGDDAPTDTRTAKQAVAGKAVARPPAEEPVGGVLHSEKSGDASAGSDRAKLDDGGTDEGGSPSQ